MRGREGKERIGNLINQFIGGDITKLYLALKVNHPFIMTCTQHHLLIDGSNSWVMGNGANIYTLDGQKSP